MNALSDLLKEANRERGLSAREIARQAREHGLRLSHDTAAKYLAGANGVPDEATLEAFSRVLLVPVSHLRRAAGLPEGAPAPYQPPAEANRLSLRQRRALDEMIRAMASEPAPLTHEHLDRIAEGTGVTPEDLAVMHARLDRGLVPGDAAGISGEEHAAAIIEATRGAVAEHEANNWQGTRRG